MNFQTKERGVHSARHAEGWSHLFATEEAGKRTGKKLRTKNVSDDEEEDEPARDRFKDNSDYFEED